LNLFILATTEATAKSAASHYWVSRLLGPLGRYDGLALIVIGIVVLIVAALRFGQTAREIGTADERPGGSFLAEFSLVGVIALLAAIYCVYLLDNGIGQTFLAAAGGGRILQWLGPPSGAIEARHSRSSERSQLVSGFRRRYCRHRGFMGGLKALVGILSRLPADSLPD
jgi:hypothetical protein